MPGFCQNRNKIVIVVSNAAAWRSVIACPQNSYDGSRKHNIFQFIVDGGLSMGLHRLFQIHDQRTAHSRTESMANANARITIDRP